MAMFHGPVQWRGAKYLVTPGQSVKVQVEKELRLEGRRYIPDLIVRCVHTDRILVVIEVWETHAVSGRKRAVYLSTGLPWIEVRAYKAYSRFRKRPLAVLDWGGIADIDPPVQPDLFGESLIPPAPGSTPEQIKTSFAVRSRDWRLPESRSGRLSADR